MKFLITYIWHTSYIHKLRSNIVGNKSCHPQCTDKDWNGRDGEGLTQIPIRLPPSEPHTPSSILITLGNCLVQSEKQHSGNEVFMVMQVARGRVRTQRSGACSPANCSPMQSSSVSLCGMLQSQMPSPIF